MRRSHLSGVAPRLAVLAFLAFSSTFAAAACGGRAAPVVSGPERLTVGLSDREVTDIARILRFEDHRSYDAAAFDSLLDDAAVEVRRRAVTAAGRIGDHAAVPLLLGALEADPSPAVRADAAFALGLLGDTSSAVIGGLEAAVPGGWVTGAAAETPVVVEVVAALGRLGVDRARELVRDALLHAGTGTTPAHRRIAAEALLTVWKFDAGPFNVAAAVPYLDSADPALRWRAAYALARGGDPSAVEHLLARAGDTDHRVRAHTARGLGARNADSVGLAAEALERLTGALDDPHPHVRTNALRSLGTYGDRAPLGTIAALLDDPDAGVSVAAVESLAAIGSRAADHLAAALVSVDRPLLVRGALLERLAALDPETAGPMARRWTGGGPSERYIAARVLAYLPVESALARAATLADDQDASVAVAALSSATAIGSDPDASPAARSGARRLLLGAAGSADPVRRAAALRLLVELAEPADTRQLVRAFRISTDEAGSSPVARSAAVAALAALAAIQERSGGDGAGMADVSDVFAGPRPTDRWILRAAAQLGDAWGEPPAAAAAEELAFYEDVVRRYIAAPLAGTARPRAVIETPHGPITLELMGEEAPLTVHNFVMLADAGFFDNGVWHRVIPNFVLQDGAPGGFVSGGPGWSIRDEISRLRYDRGVLGMALSGPDTGGSQWFITHSPQPHLDGGYAIFGRALSGMEAADAVLQGDPIPSIRVVR